MLLNWIRFLFGYRLGRLTTVCILYNCWLRNVHVQPVVVGYLVHLQFSWSHLYWTIVELLRNSHADTFRFVNIINGSVVGSHGVSRPHRHLHSGCLLRIYIHQTIVGNVWIWLRIGLLRYFLFVSVIVDHHILEGNLSCWILRRWALTYCDLNLMVSSDGVLVLLRSNREMEDLDRDYTGRVGSTITGRSHV